VQRVSGRGRRLGSCSGTGGCRGRSRWAGRLVYGLSARRLVVATPMMSTRVASPAANATRSQGRLKRPANAGEATARTVRIEPGPAGRLAEAVPTSQRGPSPKGCTRATRGGVTRLKARGASARSPRKPAVKSLPMYRLSTFRISAHRSLLHSLASLWAADNFAGTVSVVLTRIP
jgi:hypothetical protein